MEQQNQWGRLVSVSLSDVSPKHVELTADKLTIGRAQVCDICFPNNRHVSAFHCYIQRDCSGLVWLFDTSTNGTLLNKTTKLRKGDFEQLKHGDEVSVVYKRQNSMENIVYRFEDVNEDARNDSPVTEGPLDVTLQYEPSSTESSPLKRHIVDEPSTSKRHKISSSESEGDVAAGSLPFEVSEEPVDESRDEEARGKDTRDQDSGDGETRDSNNAVSSAYETETIDATTDITESKSEYGTPPVNVAESSSLCKEVDVLEPDDDSSVTNSGASSSKPVDEKDEIEETLMCIICQEIMHQCISLQPCMHTYCAGCYSEWMVRSNACPSCRKKVHRISKNHIVNNLIEAYLGQNPEKKRPEEDIKELNSKNKIHKDMLYSEVDRVEEGEDFDYESDSEHDESDEDEPPPAPVGLFGARLHPPVPLFAPVVPPPPPPPQCRQCPGYVRPLFHVVQLEPEEPDDEVVDEVRLPESTTTESPEPGPSTADDVTSGTADDEGFNVMRGSEKRRPEAPHHVCDVPRQMHAICQCCLIPMPDRRADRRTCHALPAQNCELCQRFYCHDYWGCQRLGCNGCLATFADLRFKRETLDRIILDNEFESNILLAYMKSNRITLRNMQARCLARLDDRTFSCKDQGRMLMTGQTMITSNTFLCSTCGLQNFKSLVYQFRQSILKKDLPEDVRRRPDCHWGKNCRTQRSSPHHARNYNHICEQTRFI